METNENEMEYIETEETETEGAGCGWFLLAAAGVGASLALLGKKYVYDPIKAKVIAKKESKRQTLEQ